MRLKALTAMFLVALTLGGCVQDHNPSVDNDCSQFADMFSDDDSGWNQQYNSCMETYE